MPDKSWNELWEIEQLIRRTFPPGPNTPRVTIEYVAGFEEFNTRPYHNYETFSAGWAVSAMLHGGPDNRVLLPVKEIRTVREDLDDAVRAFIEEYNTAQMNRQAHADAQEQADEERWDQEAEGREDPDA